MQYKADLPYPKIKVDGPNEQYGQLIVDNVGGMISKMSSVSLYIYNQSVSATINRELKTLFLRLSVIEMHHLQIFSELASLLGVEPRLWSIHQEYNEYWSPSYNNYSQQPTIILENAIRHEKESINKYTHQMHVIKDQNIIDILQRIILDEQVHLNLLKTMYKQLVRDATL